MVLQHLTREAGELFKADISLSKWMQKGVVSDHGQVRFLTLEDCSRACEGVGKEQLLLFWSWHAPPYSAVGL